MELDGRKKGWVKVASGTEQESLTAKRRGWAQEGAPPRLPPPPPQNPPVTSLEALGLLTILFPSENESRSFITNDAHTLVCACVRKKCRQGGKIARVEYQLQEGQKSGWKPTL